MGAAPGCQACTSRRTWLPAKRGRGQPIASSRPMLSFVVSKRMQLPHHEASTGMGSPAAGACRPSRGVSDEHARPPSCSLRPARGNHGPSSTPDRGPLHGRSAPQSSAKWPLTVRPCRPHCGPLRWPGQPCLALALGRGLGNSHVVAPRETDAPPGRHASASFPRPRWPLLDQRRAGHGGRSEGVPDESAWLQSGVLAWFKTMKRRRDAAAVATRLTC